MATVYKKSKTLSEAEKLKIKNEYGEIFDEFNQNQVSCCLFYVIFIVRRVVISVIILFLNIPEVQISISVSLCLAVKYI